MSKSEEMAREVLAKAQEKANSYNTEVTVSIQDNPDVHYLNLLHHIEVLAPGYGLKLSDHFADEYTFRKLQS